MINIRPVLRATIDAAIIKYFDRLPFDVVSAVKTEAYYFRVLERGVRDLYNGKITEDDLLTTMARLLDEQMRRAWNEGMRQNELDPQQDMTDEWEAMLQEIINNEFEYVEQFIADIVSARADKSPIDPLLARAGLWANRYNDVVNQAKLATAEPKDKYEWVYGDTEHCDTCERLNGIVARASEWEQAGFRPQSPPNEMLDCGGWRCQCALEPTDKRRSPDALTRLLDIAASRGVKAIKGGEGSGNFGHAGRPGMVGGSGPGKTDTPFSDIMGVSEGYYSENMINKINRIDKIITTGGDFGAYDDEDNIKDVFAYYNMSTERWANNLSDEEKKYLKDYSTEYYNFINSKLRGTPIESILIPDEDGEYELTMTESHINSAINNISSSIDKYSLPYDTTVYRGMESDLGFEIGDSFSDSSFVSTTINMRVASFHAGDYDNQTIFRILLPSGTNAAFVSNSLVGTNQYEVEFLLNRGTEFTIVGKNDFKYESDGRIIKGVIYDAQIKK